MGLFDELIFEIEDAALERAPEHPYQTKDLECWLMTYYIRSDRHLYKEVCTNVPELLASRDEAWEKRCKPIDPTYELVDTNYHGDIHFLGDCYRFTMRFTEGVLQWIRREEE